MKLYCSNGAFFSLVELLGGLLLEMCKMPTLQLEALNKHYVTHIMYVEMKNVICNLTKLTHNYVQDVHAHTHAHTHTRTHTRAHTHTHIHCKYRKDD